MDHASDVPCTRRARRRVGTGRRPGAAAQHGGDAGHDRIIDLLRADHVDVRIEAAGRQNFAFTGNRFGAGTDDDVDVGLGVRVAGFADTDDAPIAEPHIGFHHAPIIDNQRVGNHGVGSAGRAGCLGLPHAVTDHFAAAEFYFFTIGRVVAFDLDKQFGVG